MRCLIPPRFRPSTFHGLRCWWLIAALIAFAPARGRADVSTTISILHGYDFYYPSLSLTSDTPPLTFHWIESASGRLWQQLGDTNGAGDAFLTNDLNAVIHECTNGLWKLYLNRGHPSEQLYQFAVSITGVTTNVLGDVTIHFPVDGSTDVTSLPTYLWSGPSNLPSIFLSSAHLTGGNNYFANLPSTATQWTPGLLSPGSNRLFVEYLTNPFPGITLSTPTNAQGEPVPDWSGGGGLYSYRFSNFTVTGNNSASHSLKAHYTFDDSSFRGRDFSPNENHILTSSSWDTPVHIYVTNAAAGSAAAEFYGYSSLWLPTNLFPVLADSFTVSAWIKTTQVDGDDADSGNAGAGVVWADLPGTVADVVPLALTGSKAAFFTGDPLNLSDHTLHSSGDVVDTGEYVHVVVTRDHITGQKTIYVNGELDATGTGSAGSLDALTALGDLRLGGTFLHGYAGLLDDVQFYSGILNSIEVAWLHDHPGSTIPDVGGDGELADAVDMPTGIWTTGGDAPWFRQTDETYDGNDAAQSGGIDHDQQSWIQTTVDGPGLFSFWWNVSSEDSDGYDYLVLTVDGQSETEISGDWGWDYYEVNLSPGPHTLRWTYYKDGDFTAGQDAAWLDEAQFIPEIEVAMTLRIERSNDPENPGFFALPHFDSVQPDPLTSHEIVSPGGTFSISMDSEGVESGGYSMQPTLAALISELEAGDWTIYINRGHPTERQYTFTVTVNSLDLTNLPLVNVSSPAEWATGIATNHLFTWTGPSNYDSLFLYSSMQGTGAASGGFTNLPSNALSSRMPNPLTPGTNRLYIDFTRFGYPDIEFSEPLDSSSMPLYSWSSQVVLTSTQTRRFVVGDDVPPATPAQILNPWHTGTNFSLSLLTQLGRTHTVQSRTNLTTAPWVDVTNFVGNGATMQLFLPLTDAPETYFRVGTQ
ncbi:MAG TPA: LamG domain-containing protein [Verrucomicrobiota bacterium]|nr:LamG domain-containing protein [Verrucomicrobiota bacterium]